MKKGFDRLRGVAAASAMGLGMLGAGVGSVRAAPVSTGTSFKITVGANNSIFWGGGPTGSAQGVGNITWTGPGSNTSNGFTIKSVSSVTNSGVANFTNFGIAEGGLASVKALSSSATSASTSTGNLTDAFDMVMTMAVDGYLYANPTATPDLTNGLLSGGNMAGIVPGLDAQASLYFHPTRAVVRAFYTVTNTTAADISTVVTIMGNMGSDGSTVIEASSNGDATNDTADMWVVSSESSQGLGAVVGNDPLITTTRYGTGAAVMPDLGADVLGVGNSDNYYHHYTVTVPANGSASIMMFHEMASVISVASAGAADFETLAAANTAGFLSGLSTAQLSTLVNYGADADLDGILDTADNCPADANADQSDTDSDGIGDVCDPTDDSVTTTTTTPAATSSSSSGLSMSLPGLLAMLGLLPVLRLLRKTKR